MSEWLLFSTEHNYEQKIALKIHFSSAIYADVYWFHITRHISHIADLAKSTNMYFKGKTHTNYTFNSKEMPNRVFFLAEKNYDNRTKRSTDTARWKFQNGRLLTAILKAWLWVQNTKVLINNNDVVFTLNFGEFPPYLIYELSNFHILAIISARTSIIKYFW